MSQLRLPLHAHHGPSLSRAGALSGAMTINLLVVGALLLPAAIPQTQVGPRRVPDALTVVERVVELAATAVVPSPPALPMPVAPPVARAPTPVAMTPQLQPVLPSTSGPQLAIASSPTVVGSNIAAAAPSNAAAADSDALAYINAPPPLYPKNAIRNRWEGTVLLRVRVDTRGQPTSVEVLRSSGRGALDEAARRQVLAKWSFRPALRNGLPVEAVGTVPVVFSLGRG